MEFKQQRRLRRRKRQLEINIREMVRTTLQLLLLARIQYRRYTNGLLEVSLKYLWLIKCLLLCVHVVLKTL